jgi:hypothetical protein
MNRRHFIGLTPAFPAAAVTASLTLREEGKPTIDGLDVSVLRVKPGDVVILRCTGHITHDYANRIVEYVTRLLPEGATAMVLGDDLSVDGVLRTGD